MFTPSENLCGFGYDVKKEPGCCSIRHSAKGYWSDPEVSTIQNKFSPVKYTRKLERKLFPITV